MDPLHLEAERDDERWLLRAPEAGVFTCSLAPGAALAPGQPAGVLIRLGRATSLVVPAGVHGVVTSPRPERVHAPVGAGEVLYELAQIADLAGESAAGAEEASGGEGLPVVRAPQAGRFYVSPSPSDPPFVARGSEVHEGVAVGLIEVMKTFTQILYRTADGLPARGRVARLLVQNGADVGAGDPLVEIEDAGADSAG